MRAGFTFLALLVLAIGVFAWDKDDYEIFDLVRDLKADGGMSATCCISNIQSPARHSTSSWA